MTAYILSHTFSCVPFVTYGYKLSPLQENSEERGKVMHPRSGRDRRWCQEIAANRR